MTSPRWISLKGNAASVTDPGAPNANLLTSRWSPTRRLSSMEGVGILNAWTIKVVPNSARITVIASDSKYSRAVDFLNVSPAMSLQILESLFRRSLFGSAFCQTDTSTNDIAANLHLNGE